MELDQNDSTTTEYSTVSSTPSNASTQNSTITSSGTWSSELTENLLKVKLTKRDGTFGLNIVGGSDNPYIMGIPDFFVSQIRENTPAAEDGRIKIGDRIISVNGIKMLGKAHPEAIEIFKNNEQITLILESDAEERILNYQQQVQFPLIPSPLSMAKDIFANKSENQNGAHESETPKEDASSVEDDDSIARNQPSRIFGLERSMLPEAVLVMLGLGIIGVSVYFGYRNLHKK
uniref:PDZ domain-containing protein n=1 Tax=Acrobeloides nanus TaxID=290746 RepID=A0A914D6G3_9BILA